MAIVFRAADDQGRFGKGEFGGTILSISVHRHDIRLVDARRIDDRPERFQSLGARDHRSARIG